jgi:hypothetical protein
LWLWLTESAKCSWRSRLTKISKRCLSLLTETGT